MLREDYCVWTLYIFLAEKLISEQSVEVAEQERRVDQLEDRRESTAAQMEKLQQTIQQVSLSFH